MAGLLKSATAAQPYRGRIVGKGWRGANDPHYRRPGFYRVAHRTGTARPGGIGIVHLAAGRYDPPDPVEYLRAESVARDGSRSEEALNLLASWTATPATTEA
jgi:hypothetical protein